MITYLKMKHAEWKVKKIFFETVLAVIDSQKDTLALLQKMYNALKDMPMETFQEDFQEEFISKLAEIIHEENKND